MAFNPGYVFTRSDRGPVKSIVLDRSGTTADAFDVGLNHARVGAAPAATE